MNAPIEDNDPGIDSRCDSNAGTSHDVPSNDADGAHDVLDRLMNQMHQRAADLPEGSYTTKLMQGGDSAIAKKIIEEANETIEAAEILSALKSKLAGGKQADSDGFAKSRQHLIYEACDTIYHLWVLMGYHGISIQELRCELQRREGTSGLAEKASRKSGG